MVALQMAEALRPRGGFVSGILHPFGDGGAAEPTDQAQQIAQGRSPIVVLCQVSDKGSVDLSRIDR